MLDNECGASCGRTSCLTVAPLASSKASDVDEEVLDLFRDSDAVKQEFEWGVVAPGGGVCRVLCAQDISHVYSPIVAL